jgi:oligogalacturonide lyase
LGRGPAQNAYGREPQRKIEAIPAPAFTRRDFVGLLAAGRIYGPELQRYPDPATELPVTRLTDPAFASGFTATHLRQFSRRSDSLLHWSDRSGSDQAYLLDLKTGASRQLTDATALDRASLTLSSDEKSAFWFDGPTLNETALGSARTHVVHQVSSGTARTGITVAADGSLFFAAGAQITRLGKQKPVVIAEEPGIDLIMTRPRQPQIVWRAPSGLWLAGLDGSGKRQIKLEPGRNEEVLWTPSGRSLIYLHVPEDPKQLITLRENLPDEGADHEVARTSQFAAVSANGDASVFAGASRGKASAYVLILLRVTRRELTLCEHRASDARMVSPIFTPDSQSILFVSDRHGKSALYRVKVDKFVEATGDEPPA